MVNRTYAEYKGKIYTWNDLLAKLNLSHDGYSSGRILFYKQASSKQLENVKCMIKDEDGEYVEICNTCEELIDDCECEKCEECGELIGNCKCERCDECEELLSDCNCDRCEKCKELVDYCECKRCTDCVELIENCECERCKKCGELIDDCECECQICGELLVDCECECEKCGELIKNCDCKKKAELKKEKLLKLDQERLEYEKTKKERIEREKVDQEKLDRLREENRLRLIQEENEKIEKQRLEQKQEQERLRQEEREENERLRLENQSSISNYNILPVGRFNKYGNGHGNGNKKITTRAKLPSGEILLWTELLKRYNLPHKDGAAASIEWIKHKNNDTNNLLPDVEVVSLNGSYVPKKPDRIVVGQTKRSEIWMTHFGNVLKTICPCCVNVYDREIRFPTCYELGHNEPHSKGGTEEFDNLIPVCKECNDGMGNEYTVVEYRKILLSRKRIIE